LTITEEERRKIREQLEKHIEEIQKQFKAYMKQHPSKTIIYCQCTYSDDYEDTLKCVERVSPHVDYTILIEDGSLTEEQKAKLEAYPNVKVKTVQFKDNIPEYRNAYLEEAKKIDPYAWIMVSDPDELFCEELCREIRNITAEAERQGINMLGVNCLEAFECIEWLDDLDKLKESPAGYRQSCFYKNLIFKCSPNLRYVGVGATKTVHETWYAPDVPWRSANLDTRFYYTHRKSALKIWRNAARNVFIGGGGDNVGDLNPMWKPLREICASLGINSWREFEAYMKRGKVDERLKKWLIEALQVPATNYGTETRETAKWYFALHPDEVTPEIERRIKTSPPMPKETEIEAWVTKCYFDILGRHPDGEGKKFYTEQILKGNIPKEALPTILMQSEEYRQKFLTTVSPDEIRLAKKFKAYLAVQMKAETAGLVADTMPQEAVNHYVEIIKEQMPPDKFPEVLDIGAGDGTLVKALRDAGYRAEGITFGEENIRAAKQKYNVDLAFMDMHNLRYPPKSFDAITCIHTFEHALAPHMVVGEMRAVLKDGGRVFLAVPDPDNPQSQTIWHTNLLRRDQIIKLFEYWGFQLLNETGWFFTFEKLPDNHPKFKHNWGYLQHVMMRRP